jgi:hypothetical protein
MTSGEGAVVDQAAVGYSLRHPAVTPFTHDQASLAIEGEAIAFAGILPHHLDSLPCLPTQQPAMANIDAKRTAIGMSQRPLGKAKTGC